MQLHVTAVLGLLSTPLLVSAQAPTPQAKPAAGVVKHLDIRYAERDGVPPGLLSLDVYAPEARTDEGHPVLVMIHGGGWRIGDKRNAGMVQRKVPHFVGAGFVYVSINYRLSGDGARQAS